MSEERIENENEKTREKYFYVSKECTYKFFGTVAASFIGALLALAVFSALHKPPMPPMGPQFMPNRPCPCRIMDEGRRPGKVFLHKGKFRHHKDFRKHGEFRGPRLPQGEMMPKPNWKFEKETSLPQQKTNPEKK